MSLFWEPPITHGIKATSFDFFGQVAPNLCRMQMRYRSSKNILFFFFSGLVLGITV